MTKENVTTVSAIALALLQEKIFSLQDVGETNKDLDKLYYEFMCSENAHDTHERASVTMSYWLIKKLLASIERHQDPDDFYKMDFTAPV